MREEFWVYSRIIPPFFSSLTGQFGIYTSASAEHNIYAYRVETPSGSIREYSEDDGEHNAGYKLLKLLRDKDLTNVMVVCTRWFGGKHLGKDRFDHIETVAADALDKLGM